MANFSIKSLGTEAALSAATTLNNATCVRVVCTVAGTVTVVHTGTGTSDPSLTSTFSMLANTVEYVKKFPADTIAATGTMTAVGVAFY